MKRSSLTLSDKLLILQNKVLDVTTDSIKNLADYTSLWGVPVNTKILSVLVRDGIISEAKRESFSANVEVHGDEYLISQRFCIETDYPMPANIFIYGRDKVYSAACPNDNLIFFNSWVRGTEKRIKDGRILFYQPDCTPEGYWAIGLPIEFRITRKLAEGDRLRYFLKSLLRVRKAINNQAMPEGNMIK